jgi:hypothetical protein
MQKGVDSATEPTLAQVQAAKQQGFTFWGFYIRGPGAFHDWGIAGTQALEDGGMLPLPIYVPALNNGRIASSDPTGDAQAFVAAYQARGMDGAGVLDTEASMRGFGETGPYTASFMTELRNMNQADICYAGGFMMSGPPQATYKWWIQVPGDPVPNEMIQGGSGNIAGINVDLDTAADNVPMCHWTNVTPPVQYPKPETTATALLVENNKALRVICPFCKHCYDVAAP